MAPWMQALARAGSLGREVRPSVRIARAATDGYRVIAHFAAGGMDWDCGGRPDGSRCPDAAFGNAGLDTTVAERPDALLPSLPCSPTPHPARGLMTCGRLPVVCCQTVR
jgi:hypothetical protein